MPNLAEINSVDTNPAIATDQYDTPWKIAVEQHFQPFIAFYFPAVYAEIDWQVPHEFLDKEFQAIARDALVGARHVDKLVKVQRHSGRQDWLCLHLEVQVARQTHFARRMFVYNYRIFDFYDRPVASLALLGDDDPAWLPDQFSYSAMGCEMAFRFPVAKLAAFSHDADSLANHPNPFALLTLAYLQNRATRTDMQARFDIKCSLIRLLHARNWDKALIKSFFLVIDWMMELPVRFDEQLASFVTELEKEQEMEYVSTVERVRLEQKWQEGLAQGEDRGLERGIERGMQQGESTLLVRLLTRRFGVLPPTLQQRIGQATPTEIEAWFDRALDAVTLHEVFQDLPH